MERMRLKMNASSDVILERADGDFFSKIQGVAEQCARCGIDPIEVLAKALLEKTRMEGMIQDALNEEFSKNDE